MLLLLKNELQKSYKMNNEMWVNLPPLVLSVGKKGFGLEGLNHITWFF